MRFKDSLKTTQILSEGQNNSPQKECPTADYMQTVPSSVYTLLMVTVDPSQSTEVAEGTVFRELTVLSK